VRYLSLSEAVVIAEAVTGIDPLVLAKSGRIDLLDSALHAPQASFGGEEFYPEFVDKAAVLAVRIARNHPLQMATSALPGAASTCSASSMAVISKSLWMMRWHRWWRLRQARSTRNQWRLGWPAACVGRVGLAGDLRN
jgi:hypothetical protein